MATMAECRAGNAHWPGRSDRHRCGSPQREGEWRWHPDAAPLAATPNEGNHHFFRQRPGEKLGNGRGALPAGIDVRGHGGYVIAPGAVMADGRTYELFGNLVDAPVIPDWLHGILTAPKCDVDKPISEKKQRVALAPNYETAGDAEIAEMLGHIDPDLFYHEWITVLMAVHAVTGGAGIGLADAWSARGSSFKRTGVTLGTLAALARQHGADLSAIAIKHRGRAWDYDKNEAAEAARQFLAHADGTIADAETGEIVEEGVGAPGDWTRPGGLIGDIAEWILSAAMMPNRRLSLAASIAVVSTVASRHLCTPTSSGLHLYTICTAQTGVGKDWPLKAIERLLIEIGLSMLVSSGKVTTSLAIESSLSRQPAQIIIADEIGKRIFGKAGHKRASTYESGITDTLLELWSASPGDMIRTTQRVGSDALVLEAPAVSIFGVSNHRDLYSSLGRASIDNGMINRVLFMEADPRTDMRDVDVDEAKRPPEHVVNGLADLKPATDKNNLASGLACYTLHTGVTARVVPWADTAAKEAWRAFQAEMLSYADRNEENAPFVRRAAEQAIRLATIWSLSRYGRDAAMVSVPAVEWGISVARESVANAISGTAEHIVSSDFQEHYRRVERMIKERGEAPLSIIARKLGGAVDNRTLQAVIDALKLAGKVTEERANNRGVSYVWKG